MKLIIGPTPYALEKKSGFYIECAFMHGDADHEEKEETRLGSKAKTIKCLKWINSQPQHPSTGGDKEEWEEWHERGFFDFPFDVFFHGQRCQLDGHEIFFYDADGLKHSVAQAGG